MRCGNTSDFSTSSGLLVMMTSSNVAEVGVILVGPLIICVNLFFLIIRSSLLLIFNRSLLRSPRKNIVYLCNDMALSISVI